MRQVNCPVCGTKSAKYGKTNAGAQRWYCKECKMAFTVNGNIKMYI